MMAAPENGVAGMRSAGARGDDKVSHGGEPLEEEVPDEAPEGAGARGDGWESWDNGVPHEATEGTDAWGDGWGTWEGQVPHGGEGKDAMEGHVESAESLQNEVPDQAMESAKDDDGVSLEIRSSENEDAQDEVPDTKAGGKDDEDEGLTDATVHYEGRAAKELDRPACWDDVGCGSKEGQMASGGTKKKKNKKGKHAGAKAACSSDLPEPAVVMRRCRKKTAEVPEDEAEVDKKPKARRGRKPKASCAEPEEEEQESRPKPGRRRKASQGEVRPGRAGAQGTSGPQKVRETSLRKRRRMRRSIGPSQRRRSADPSQKPSQASPNQRSPESFPSQSQRSLRCPRGKRARAEEATESKKKQVLSDEEKQRNSFWDRGFFRAPTMFHKT